MTTWFVRCKYCKIIRVTASSRVLWVFSLTPPHSVTCEGLDLGGSLYPIYTLIKPKNEGVSYREFKKLVDKKKLYIYL